MRTLLTFSFIATVLTLFAGLPAQSAKAATLTGAALHAPAQSRLPVETVACNGTWGKWCGPGLHRVCTPNGGCQCVACGGGGYGYGYGGYGGGWARRGWYGHYWHRGHGGYHGGYHGHHGAHHYFHHHGHHHHGHHGHRGHHGHHGHHGGHHRSDMRLKQDIIALGQLDNGLTLYRFRYQGADQTAYVGVMAQDVEKVDPRAVSHDADGFMSVDYDRLGLDFLTWDEWVARNGTNPFAP